VLGQSIENWRHPNLADDAYGADDSYYLSLPKPYHSPHTDFKSVDELLLVRGITEDHFYGATWFTMTRQVGTQTRTDRLV